MAIPPHLLPDESDERRDLRASKKTPPLARTVLPTAAEVRSELTQLRRAVLIPALVRTTTASRPGCAPNPPQFEENTSTHTLLISKLESVSDLHTQPLWHDSDDAPPLLLQAPEGTPGCGSLALSKNDVLTILPRLEALTCVAITHNYLLERLPIEVLHHLPHLKKLDLSYNRLRHIPAALFVKPRESGGVTPAFPDLLELSLETNALGSVPKEMFTSMPRLWHLSLGNNFLAGLPSTFGNHATPSAALKQVLLHNNIIGTEVSDAAEVEHCVATYDMLSLDIDTYYETIACGGVLSRDRERELQALKKRMPLKKKPSHLQASEIYPEGTRVLLALLHRELQQREYLDQLRSASDRHLDANEATARYYDGETGWRLDWTTCNLCRADLALQFAAYRSDREQCLMAMEREVQGDTYRSKKAANDFSFFLHSDEPAGRPPFRVLDEGQLCAAWEADEELLWVIGEAANGGLLCNRVAVQPHQQPDTLSDAQRVAQQMKPFGPPYCCAKYIHAAGVKDAPLLYFLCGSDVCRKALDDLNADGNAVQNFSRIDYSRETAEDD